MSNYLVIDIVCLEVSERPIMCHVVDLDKARDGGVQIEWSSEHAARAFEALSETLGKADAS